MLEEQQFEPIKMWIAYGREGAEALKRAEKDPILLQGEGSILVWFKATNTEVAHRIQYGNNWSTGEYRPDEYGYIFYDYTRLDLEQLTQHISNPNKFRGDN